MLFQTDMLQDALDRTVDQENGETIGRNMKENELPDIPSAQPDLNDTLVIEESEASMYTQYNSACEGLFVSLI